MNNLSVEENVVEGNKLIAEFMGLKYRFVKYPNPQLNYWMVDKGNYEAIMQYHSSWDWLMPVVEKIRGLGHRVDIRIIKEFVDCVIYEVDENVPLINKTYSKGEEAVWLAVIEFIKWYNNQKIKV